MGGGVTPHEHAVADRFLAEASARREPLVVALSGAHAYGFPSPDSDLDLKAIHIAPTRALLGLRPDTPPVEHTEIVLPTGAALTAAWIVGNDTADARQFPTSIGAAAACPAFNRHPEAAIILYASARVI